MIRFILATLLLSAGCSGGKVVVGKPAAPTCDPGFEPAGMTRRVQPACASTRCRARRE
jgi:hypothetical protein